MHQQVLLLVASLQGKLRSPMPRGWLLVILSSPQKSEGGS